MRARLGIFHANTTQKSGAVRILTMLKGIVDRKIGCVRFVSAMPIHLSNNSFFGKFISISLCWTFSFHILNEIRHLIWDAGYGFDLKISKITGYATLILSFLLAIIIYFLGVSL